ncbi:MAG: hypothetical protein LBP88_06010 [Treponema sp.]|nr:hypothetical protein [Treponema sp.]
MIEFDLGDSGKTAYFAVQIENEGTKGPWEPSFLRSFHEGGNKKPILHQEAH